MNICPVCDEWIEEEGEEMCSECRERAVKGEHPYNKEAPPQP